MKKCSGKMQLLRKEIDYWQRRFWTACQKKPKTPWLRGKIFHNLNKKSTLHSSNKKLNHLSHKLNHLSHKLSLMTNKSLQILGIWFFKNLRHQHKSLTNIWIRSHHQHKSIGRIKIRSKTRWKNYKLRKVRLNQLLWLMEHKINLHKCI